LGSFCYVTSWHHRPLDGDSVAALLVAIRGEGIELEAGGGAFDGEAEGLEGFARGGAGREVGDNAFIVGVVLGAGGGAELEVHDFGVGDL